MEDLDAIRQAMTFVYELLSDPKTAQTIARMYRQLFHSLKEEGFTEEQALSIVRAFSFNSSKSA